MLRGLYTSALGMTTQMQRMDVISNNLANVNTIGFKRDAVAAQSFSELMAQRVDDPAVSQVMRMFPNARVGQLTQGLFIDEVYTDFNTSGGMQETGAPLDLSIQGNGFFTVNVLNALGGVQTRYTRDGAFTLSNDGTLMTSDGGRVQGLGGDIVIPPGEITIGENGFITVNNQAIDTLLIANFSNLDSLRKAGNDYYDIIDETEEAPFTGMLRQGFLENGNVQAVREMVELISLSRAYEANSRMVTIHDESLGRAVSEIARR